MAAELLSLAVAEAMFVLARSQAILVAAKTNVQRTELEQERINRGLGRSLALEFFLFVPVSTFVVLVTIRHMLPSQWMAQPGAYGLLGLISYGFPFMAFKKFVQIWAIRALKSFYDVLTEQEKAELERSTARAGINAASIDQGGTGA